MLKRELSRILILSIIGIAVAFSMMVNRDASIGMLIIAPIYLIGMFYAGKTLIAMIATVAKTYFQCQVMSFFTNPLWGTILCSCLFGLGMAVVLSIGWIIGIGKCIYSLVIANQLDRQMM